MPELPAPDKLNSHWLLTALKADGRIDAAQQARAATRIAGSREHPLIAVGQCELEDQGEDGGLLDAERLTEWLAERTDTRYQRIDPLQIDPAATAQAVAYAYARKAGIRSCGAATKRPRSPAATPSTCAGRPNWPRC